MIVTIRLRSFKYQKEVIAPRLSSRYQYLNLFIQFRLRGVLGIDLWEEGTFGGESSVRSLLLFGEMFVY